MAKGNSGISCSAFPGVSQTGHCVWETLFASGEAWLIGDGNIEIVSQRIHCEPALHKGKQKWLNDSEWFQSQPGVGMDG